MEGLSPMMQQYFRIKDKHRDHILFYRLGDFYEMFFEDAILGSRELGLTLTGRDCGLSERAPMCGVPYHSCEGYIAKLVKKGYKVAICEQMEDPATAKGVVAREVVRVITPGTVLENNLLAEDSNNFLCSIYLADAGYGLVFADISTGELHALELERDDDVSLQNELARYLPREVVFNPAFMDKTDVAKFMREKLCCTADLLDESAFDPAAATEKVQKHFNCGDVNAIGFTENSRCVPALGALLVYLADTQKQGIERLITVNVQDDRRFMNLDQNARANLELLQTMRTKERRGSLLWVLDKTRTPMGKRLIKAYINQPLLQPAEIEKRLNAVEELFDDEIRCAGITDVLLSIYDIERLTTRIVYGNATPREYKTLGQAIGRFPDLKAELYGVKSQYLTAIDNEIDPLQDVATAIDDTVKDEPPNSLKDGGVIAPGHSPALDELRELVGNAREYLARMESEQRELTGIKNLKIGFNKVFGYYLEVTKSYLDLVPQHYIRKQTLANGERYIIEELKILEEKILTAHDSAVALEQQLFEVLRQKICAELARIQRAASAIARLDVFASFASVALENRYVRPKITMGDKLSIIGGRHPVVEQLLDNAPFVPNDTLLDCAENRVAIVTGPNMAGKSTYMRQTALVVLMAQIGCFVPADSAEIGVVDGIFTRIGASDDLVAGKSTFMVEMCEVAQILREATAKSLLILDEIGRGTSTYDGMSIARAVIEFVADRKRLGAKTLFATHYHELTEMENDQNGVKNYNIAVKKRGDDITFLRKIVRGGADDSYGIEVSKLAGIPQSIITRAHEVLEDLENSRPVREQKRRGRRRAEETPDEMQISMLPDGSEVLGMLRDVDLNTLTPLEALNLLYKLKEKAK